MGLILNNNVSEEKIMQAYGLTVYGKINRYVWTLEGNREENALIDIRITRMINGKENTIFSMQMGNRCIFQCRIDDTMDNFLYWIATEKPDTYSIEKQVYKSLCQSDSLFNHLIRQKKDRQRKADAERQRMEEAQKKERADIDSIKTYCKEKGLFYYIGYEEVVLIKATNNNDRKMIAEAQRKDDTEKLKMIMDFIRKYPDNNNLKVVYSGTMEEILQYIA